MDYNQTNNISVIVPVFNDADGLKDTLDSLLCQDLNHAFYEIIVVDNNSQDNTFLVAKEYEEQYPYQVKVFIEKNRQSSYAARNKGIDKARYGILCFIDANVTVQDNVLSLVQKEITTSNIDYLGANVKMYIKNKSITSNYNFVNGFKIKNAIEKSHYTPTCFLAVRKDVISKIGGFDANLVSGGDFEFGQRVYEANFKMSYCRKIVILHPTRYKYRHLIGKTKRVGLGYAQLVSFYPKKYGYLRNNLLTIKAFLPKNPLSYYKVLKQNGIRTSLGELLLLSVYHIPIKFFNYLAFNK